jgi:hypothetical protein
VGEHQHLCMHWHRSNQTIEPRPLRSRRYALSFWLIAAVVGATLVGLTWDRPGLLAKRYLLNTQAETAENTSAASRALPCLLPTHEGHAAPSRATSRAHRLKSPNDQVIGFGGFTRV